MTKTDGLAKTALAAGIFALACGSAVATEPCDDFGECKVLVEINASDGDVGFHFLMDGEDLRYGALFNPRGRKIYSYHAKRELARQFITETFNETAEPLCWHPEPDDDEYGEPVVTLSEFMDRWDAGTYYFFGIGDRWEFSFGESTLSFDLPAAPQDVEYTAEEDDGEIEGDISWAAGDDLGECSDDGMDELDTPPEEVEVLAWEVVLEPDVDDGDPLGAMKYVVRIPYWNDDLAMPNELEVEVPNDYLGTLPADTPGKVEVGAIGVDDNATFTEADEICLNDTNPPPEELLEEWTDGCGFVHEPEGEEEE